MIDLPIDSCSGGSCHCTIDWVQRAKLILYLQVINGGGVRELLEDEKSAPEFKRALVAERNAQIDNLIDFWHLDIDGSIPIAEFLGLTDNEYVRYVEKGELPPVPEGTEGSGQGNGE